MHDLEILATGKVHALTCILEEHINGCQELSLCLRGWHANDVHVPLVVLPPAAPHAAGRHVL